MTLRGSTGSSYNTSEEKMVIQISQQVVVSLRLEIALSLTLKSSMHLNGHTKYSLGTKTTAKGAMSLMISWTLMQTRTGKLSSTIKTVATISSLSIHSIQSLVTWPRLKMAGCIKYGGHQKMLAPGLSRTSLFRPLLRDSWGESWQKSNSQKSKRKRKMLTNLTGEASIYLREVEQCSKFRMLMWEVKVPERDS